MKIITALFGDEKLLLARNGDKYSWHTPEVDELFRGVDFGAAALPEQSMNAAEAAAELAYTAYQHWYRGHRAGIESSEFAVGSRAIEIEWSAAENLYLVRTGDRTIRAVVNHARVALDQQLPAVLAREIEAALAADAAYKTAHKFTGDSEAE